MYAISTKKPVNPAISILKSVLSSLVFAYIGILVSLYSLHHLPQDTIKQFYSMMNSQFYFVMFLAGILYFAINITSVFSDTLTALMKFLFKKEGKKTVILNDEEEF